MHNTIKYVPKYNNSNKPPSTLCTPPPAAHAPICINGILDDVGTYPRRARVYTPNYLPVPIGTPYKGLSRYILLYFKAMDACTCNILCAQPFLFFRNWGVYVADETAAQL